LVAITVIRSKVTYEKLIAKKLMPADCNYKTCEMSRWCNTDSQKP